GGAAKFTDVMMGSKQGDAAVEFCGQRYLLRGRLAARGNATLKCPMREADDAVDEVAEDIGEVLVHIGDEFADGEVGVRRFRRVRDQPPAPDVRRQFLQGLIGEYAAPSARAELSSVRIQP